MPKAIMISISCPSSPEREQEYNEWYDATHAPEVLRTRGLVSARRFRLADRQLTPGASLDERPYVVVYEIDSEDLDATISDLRNLGRGGRLTLSDSLQTEPWPRSVIYELVAGPIAAT